jgi:hypothetical protein
MMATRRDADKGKSLTNVNSGTGPEDEVGDLTDLGDVPAPCGYGPTIS